MKTYIWLAFFILALPLVSANVINDAIDPLIGFNIALIYQQFSTLIDFILFTIFFAAISKKLIAERIGEKAALMIGLILGISLTAYLWTIQVNLTSFGPAAAVMFLAIFGYIIYALLLAMFSNPSHIMEDEGKAKIAAAIAASVITLFLAFSIVPSLAVFLKQYALGRLLVALIYLLLVILMFWGFIKAIKAMFPGTTTPPDPHVPPPPIPVPTPPPIPAPLSRASLIQAGQLIARAGAAYARARSPAQKQRIMAALQNMLRGLP